MSENHRNSRAIEARLHRDLAFDACPRPGDDARLQRLVAGAAAGTIGLGAIWLALRTSARVQLAVIAVTTATVTASTAAWMSAPPTTRQARVLDGNAASVGVEDPPARSGSSASTIAPTTPPTIEAQPSAPAEVDRAASTRSFTRAGARSDAAVAASEPSAAELLAAASAARAERSFTRASELYRTLASRYPLSREAAVGCVAHGRLQLERGEASAAARLFADCIADHPQSPVEEQALVGHAEALGAIGKQDEAAAAWAELRRRYPDTLHRGR